MQEKFQLLERAAELIINADSIIIAAGAGMGVDSGLPDFRGNKGFWKAYPMFKKSKLDFMDLANAINFLTKPKVAWGFYGHRLELYRSIIPHKGFSILKKWADQKPNGYSIFTSNVDGQFQKAGFASDRIHECHGSIHHLQCISRSCNASLWSSDEFTPILDKDTCLLINSAPICEHCGCIARPNILMFDDKDWITTRTYAQSRQQDIWLETVKNPVVIELGAGIDIPSVRYFSESIVNEHSGRLIRINPRESTVTSKLDIGLQCGALDALKEIDQLLNI